MIKEGHKPTWKNKLYFMNFPNAVVVFGITLLLIGSTIIIAPVHTSAASPIDSRAIVWDVRLDMSEDLEGTSDYVVFGEAPDANDGPPADSYDQPKPPAPMLPFVRAWFDDGLSPPYNQLLKDYREYNNTNYKEWNLTIHWMPDGALDTDVNVTWDSNEFNDSEYDIVILYDINNNDEVDMILNSYYEFLCPAYVPQDFTINCSIIPNQPPVAVNDTATTPEDTTVVIEVLDNDYDSDGTIDPTTVTIVDDVSHGNTSVNGTTGEVTYTPDPNYYGSDNFTYNVDDDDGNTSNEATVSITVTDVNDPPVAVNDTTSTPEDTTVDIDVIANDVDIDGTIDPTTVVIVSDVTHGATSVNPSTGVVTYTPGSNYYGPDSFTYEVDDDDGATSNVATVSITVGDVNDPPVANNDTASTPEDTQVDIDVIANDVDIDGTIDPTTVTIVDDTEHGNTSVNGTTGEVTYTPDPDYYGSDSFAYTVDDDDSATSNEATVSITVTDVNDPPVFSSETPTNGTTGVSISTSSLSVTIEDPDGDSYNWSIQTSPDIGNSSGNGTNNSIISCDISGLAYSTTYTWFVSVTDEKDWTNESYSFTTKAKSGGGGSGSGAENQNPVADANGPYSGFINEEITFNGSESTDDGTITNYTWNFGDGNTGYDEITTHTYIKAGTYVITLTVTDDGELKNTDETTAEISQPNIPPEMQTVTGSTSGTKDTEYTYNATATDEDNDMIQYHFDWDDGTTNTTAFLPNGTAATQTHTWAAAGKYTISVQAHDNQTPSDITRYTVLIDTRIVDDIGYITDDDANGTYDTFHDTDLETDLGQDEDGKYYIDSDGDGEWNYVYDPETEELTEYEAEPTPYKEDYTGIILLGLLIIIIIIIFFYMVMKKKKTEPPKKNKK